MTPIFTSFFITRSPFILTKKENIIRNVSTFFFHWICLCSKVFDDGSHHVIVVWLYIHTAVVVAAAALLAFFWWNKPVTDSLFFFFVSFLLFFFFCFYLVYRHLFHFDICAWTFGHGSLAPAAYILIPDLRFSISMISYPSVDWSRLFSFILPFYFF